MSTVLSTKILSPSQKELLLNKGIGLVQYNAITVDFVDIELTEFSEHLIFTSQNAVHAFLRKTSTFLTSTKNFSCFCVGEKTKALLEKSGFAVIETAANALALGAIILKKYRNFSFLFLCGNRRRDDLPHLLDQHAIAYKEGEIYKTQLVAKTFERQFDGLLFFSPSAVLSFTKQNKIKESVAFCIGETTAGVAGQHTQNIIIASNPTIENVIVQVVKYYAA